jgi:hypothetical protein
MRRLFLLSLLGLLSAVARADNWVLRSSTLTYHVTHRLHKVEGTSHAARGKGLCDAGGCQFLVAAPVNSFDSGDTNRDLHMIETTRGATFPMVKVTVKMPAAPTGETFAADLGVEFSGQSHVYTAVPFTVAARANGGLTFKGVVPLNVDDFKIPKPSLLGMAIKPEVPIDLEMTWVNH